MFTFRQALVAAMLAIPAAGTGAEDMPVLTLDQCLSIGAEHSIRLANAARERRIADEQISLIRAQVFPSMDTAGAFTRLSESIRVPGLEAGSGGRDQYTASATAEQLLYSGGSVRAALRAAQSYRTRADEEVARATADIKREITKAYYLVLYREAAVNVARASVEQLAQVEAEAKLKFESGVLSEFEWLSARVRLANEKPVLIATENQRDVARLQFRNLLYLDSDRWALADAWIEPEISMVEEDQDLLPTLLEYGLANRWELRQAEAYLDVLEADVKVTEGRYLPEIKAFATYAGADPAEYDPTNDGWDWQWLAGVRATWNLFDGGARGAERMEKLLRQEIAGDAITDLVRAIRLEIETAFRNRWQALRALEGSRETIQLAEKAMEIARLRFERGLATNIEFTDRNLELNKARIQHLGGLLVYFQSMADLTYACGGTNPFEPRIAP